MYSVYKTLRTCAAKTRNELRRRVFGRQTVAVTRPSQTNLKPHKFPIWDQIKEISDCRQELHRFLEGGANGGNYTSWRFQSLKRIHATLRQRRRDQAARLFTTSIAENNNRSWKVLRRSGRRGWANWMRTPLRIGMNTIRGTANVVTTRAAR